MSGTITLDQFKALLKEELTSLKEAVEANTARLTSMEFKLEAHDASFGDVKLRLGVLEDAPVHSKVKEHIKSAVATESQSFMEDKEAALSSLVASTHVCLTNSSNILHLHIEEIVVLKIEPSWI